MCTVVSFPANIMQGHDCDDLAIHGYWQCLCIACLIGHKCPISSDSEYYCSAYMYMYQCGIFE